MTRPEGATPGWGQAQGRDLEQPVARNAAGILSAYDELMENSPRRIRPLEAMARALYRGWFVHFRIPAEVLTNAGADPHLPRVASPLGDIAQGWEVRTVKDVATVTYRFPFASKAFNTDGSSTPVIRIRDIPEGFSPTFTEEDAEPKYHVRNGPILVGMDGDFHMCIGSSGHASQNQRVARFESDGEIANLHLFLALEKPIQEFNKAIGGTTVAHLRDMHIKTIQIVWPPATLRAKTREALAPMSEQIIGLKRQTPDLRRTGDLLLRATHGVGDGGSLRRTLTRPSGHPLPSDGRGRSAWARDEGRGGARSPGAHGFGAAECRAAARSHRRSPLRSLACAVGGQPLQLARLQQLLI